jgi:prepilin-type N-terminal cleavage/methylation domain-containing protein
MRNTCITLRSPHRPRRTRCRRRGFTLIELLVVIAVIAILLGILFPSLAKAKAGAKYTVCQANLKGVGNTFLAYLNQNNDVMPVAADMPSLGLNSDPRICDVLAKDMGGSGVLQCPSDAERTYFQTEGSSYQYNSLLDGKKQDRASRNAATTQIMFDYEPFHGPAGTHGSCNYLFLDMHVGDLI